ncbi:hypothetical protein EI42_04012 [Thermosporothrix hazakensis]|jgi:hypothetical protein|uniref:Uncharacterized protein n=2 Tax=Thermosporothrix hazakensis TaxID=644383 RepID=A0A326U2S8_THEHA|nr:hypothetical protein [Thermosporothrix hazakensis]PZW26053.1 hypothetical protein EI42_04012 [Thermosporothrix hazakensis]
MRESMPLEIIIAGRHLEEIQRRSNLSRLAALQLGVSDHPVTCVPLDLLQQEQIQQVLEETQPDIVLLTASLQRWVDVTSFFPVAVWTMAPLLPLYLPLAHNLMQAVKRQKKAMLVLNPMYPDVVHPVLNTIGLAPTAGVGELANNLPALRLVCAQELGVEYERLELRLIMARAVSYALSRRPLNNAPYHISVLVDGIDVTDQLNLEAVFKTFPAAYPRPRGTAGLPMTAASALVTIRALLSPVPQLVHVPGPQGLPGGYPVFLSRNELSLALPASLSLEEALRINEAGLQLDGIRQVTEDGTVIFTDEAREMCQRLYGEDYSSLRLQDTEKWAWKLRPAH